MQKSMTIADHSKNANIQPYNKHILGVCCPGTIFCALIPNEQDGLPVLRDLGVHRVSQTSSQFPMCCDNSFDKMHPNVMEEPRRGISIWKHKRSIWQIGCRNGNSTYDKPEVKKLALEEK